MCSTPKPKRKIKAKISNASTGILSSINTEKRRSFALRANQANERRVQAKKSKLAALKCLTAVNEKSIISEKKRAKIDTNQSWLYWFFNASFNEIYRKIIMEK